MANTFISISQAQAPAQNQSMMSIFNAGSTVIIKVYRIWFINTRITTTTGALSVLKIRHLTARTGAGSAVTATTKMDSGEAALDGDVYIEKLACTGATQNLTSDTTLRMITVNYDENKVATLDNSSWWGLPASGLIWDAGWGNSIVQPITLRLNEGVDLYNVTNTTGGAPDVSMEFTQEAV